MYPEAHTVADTFLKRNPRVASVVGRKIEAARAEGATPVQIRAQRCQQSVQAGLIVIDKCDQTRKISVPEDTSPRIV